MRRIKYLSLICIIFFSFLQCSKKVSYNYISSTDDLVAEAREVSGEGNKKACQDPNNYAPDIDNPLLHKLMRVKVNVHFMYDAQGRHNFPQKEAKKFMSEMLVNGNDRLGKPKPMNLPVGNNTPTFPAKMEYVLTPQKEVKGDDGFHYHRDDELYYFINKGRNKNNYSRDVIKKYNVGGDSILNIFILPHHPDSVKSKSYKPRGSGIALGNSLKMAGMWENTHVSWHYGTLLNHEIGHIFGLKHSWIRNDGCDETPKHDNCWQDYGKGKCAGKVASNNFMDYNNSQMAITPCQMGIVRKNIADLNARQRKMIIPDWCNLDASQTIYIRENTKWLGNKDLHHDVVVKSGKTLEICCRISFPKDARLIVEPGAKLVLNNTHLHNTCGDTWLGIEIVKAGEKEGLVEYIGDVKIENVLESSQK